MDKIYAFTKNKKILLSQIILGCAALYAINTLKRPDYNLFLFIFLYMTLFTENQNISIKKLINERLYLTIVFVFSILVDAVYIFTHHKLGVIFSFLNWIGFIAKVLVTCLVAIMWIGLQKEKRDETNRTGFNEFKEEVEN